MAELGHDRGGVIAGGDEDRRERVSQLVRRHAVWQRWLLGGGEQQYNAVCQWLRARRDARDPADAAQVLKLAPQWPALRGTDSGAVIAEAVAGGTPLAGVLQDCDRSHSREVAYAKSLGLPPSS